MKTTKETASPVLQMIVWGSAVLCGLSFWVGISRGVSRVFGISSTKALIGLLGSMALLILAFVLGWKIFQWNKTSNTNAGDRGQQ